MNVLKLFCNDKPGIVAAVATTLANHECNIEESSQFNDPLSGQFFMRVVFSPLNKDSLKNFQAAFGETAKTFDMHWEIGDLTTPVKTVLLVSKTDHCLHDILYRWRTGHLNIDITAVISNHDDNRAIVEQAGLPFHHLPITKETKAAQEQQISDIIEETGSELIILARYMQILSNNMAKKYAGRVINIHHSFLPGFKGAKPYHQAYERGVKIIGATAHFASEDLDEGPIIAQEIVHVDHRHTPQIMQAMGRDTESRTLSKAIDLYAKRRIFLHDARTVIL